MQAMSVPPQNAGAQLSCYACGAAFLVTPGTQPGTQVACPTCHATSIPGTIELAPASTVDIASTPQQNDAPQEADPEMSRRDAPDSYWGALLKRHPVFRLLNTKPSSQHHIMRVLTFAITTAAAVLWFASFSGIELYMDLNCQAGCEPFLWPPTNTSRPKLIINPRFKEDAWPVGTKMCYPVAGQGEDGGTLEGKYFPSGPAYQKPFPEQWCFAGKACDYPFSSPDKLYTWTVQVNTLWGVIFDSVEGSPHHCKKDQCYYVRESMHKNSCNNDPFEITGFAFWWLTVVNQIFGFVIQTILSWAFKRGGAIRKRCLGCFCFFLCPSMVILGGAALFSGIFARVLFAPVFSSLALGWVAEVALVMVSVLIERHSKKGVSNGLVGCLEKAVACYDALVGF